MPLRIEDEAKLLDHLRAALGETEAEYRERLAPALPRVWHRELDELARNLRGWIRHELQDPSGFSPLYAELAFGLGLRDEQDEASHTEPVQILETYPVRGSIDLIERRDEDGRLRITDYKTGRRPSESDRERALQPIVYALAAEAMMDAEVESARLSYCTERERFASDYFTPGAQARAHLKQHLERIEAHVDHGYLPALPTRHACTYCDYRPICGLEEETRAERKDPAARDRFLKPSEERA